MLDTLSEVLDLVDFGIVLLDRNMRVQLVDRRCYDLCGAARTAGGRTELP